MQRVAKSRAEGPVHILTDIAMKHDKTQCLRVRSSEVRAENSRAPGASQNAKIGRWVPHARRRRAAADLIATAHSAGPGYGLYVVSYML